MNQNVTSLLGNKRKLDADNLLKRGDQILTQVVVTREREKNPHQNKK